jgi:hypothetical protein
MQRVTVIIEDDESTVENQVFTPWATFIPRPHNPCDDCPNNIKNGGSGFCCCSLPSMYMVTY